MTEAIYNDYSLIVITQNDHEVNNSKLYFGIKPLGAFGSLNATSSIMLHYCNPRFM